MRTRTLNGIGILLVLSLMIGLGGCKSQKKLAREKAEAEYAAMVDQAKQDLASFIDGTSTLPLDAKEDRLQEIKDMNIDDEEVRQLIAQAEEVLAAERTARMKAEMEAKRLAEEKAKRMESGTVRLSDYFASVARSSSVSEANLFINEALQLFSSPDAPVLIIISQEGTITDYDRPTTIKNYLNYLKDTGNNNNSIHNIEYDANGKIKELELKKSF